MIWEKRDDETSKAYDWFCKYRDMGPDRSLIKLSQKYNRGDTYKSQLAKWSRKYKWTTRVEAYDAHLEDLKRNENENRVLKSLEQQIELADTVMEKCLRNLAVLDDISNPTQWKSLAEFAVKTKRDALGIADKYEINADVSVDRETGRRLSADLLERTKRLLGELDADTP
jgi:hypothetical protein